MMQNNIFSKESTNHTLSVQIIVFPERSELMFSTHIPDGELQVLVFNSFHVKTFKDREPSLFRRTLRSSVLLNVH